MSDDCGSSEFVILLNWNLERKFVRCLEFVDLVMSLSLIFVDKFLRLI